MPDLSNAGTRLPAKVLAMTGVRDVAMAMNGCQRRTCAVKLDGSVECWGDELDCSQPAAPKILISSGAKAIHMSGSSRFLVEMLDGKVKKRYGNEPAFVDVGL